MTALAVPLIARFGLPAFTIAAATVTGALIAWGIKRAGHGGRGLESVERGVMLPAVRGQQVGLLSTTRCAVYPPVLDGAPSRTLTFTSAVVQQHAEPPPPFPE